MIPRVRLSPKYATGTIQERMKYADRLNEQLFSRIFPLYKNKDAVEIGRIEEECAFTIPETIDFRIERLSKKDAESSYSTLNLLFGDDKISAYEINVPTASGKLDISNLPWLIHENTHMLDYILNPKIIKTDEKLCEKDLYDSVNDFFEKKYYLVPSITEGKERLRKLRKKTKKFLSNRSVEDKLLILNYLKNNILLEKHAHLQDRKNARFLRSAKRRYDRRSAVYSESDYRFDEKLEIVNEMLYETIRKERYKNAQRITKNPIEKARNFFEYHFGR